MSLEIRYYPFIVKVARYFDKINYQDLAQDVCIKLIVNTDKANEIETDGKLKPYIYVITKNEYLASRRREEPTDLDTLDVKEEVEIDYKKELEDLIHEKNLSFIDRLWVDAFISRDLNATWVESSLNIGRHCAKDRLNEIINKLR